MLSRVFAPRLARGIRTFFNDGFKDNTSLETVYRGLVKTSPVADKLLEFYAKNLDAASLESLAGQAKEGNTVCVPLQPYLGDPHRVLFAYSLLPAKVSVEKDGNPIVEAKIADEKQRIKIIDAELITFLGQELLKKLGLQPTPEAARSYIDAMLEGADAEASKILAKEPAEPSLFEKTVAEIKKETGPLDQLKNLEKTEVLDDVKYKNLPHPVSGRVEGKKKYFVSA